MGHEHSSPSFCTGGEMRMGDLPYKRVIPACPFLHQGATSGISY